MLESATKVVGFERKSVRGYSSNKMISEEEALKIWNEVNLPEEVREHSRVVQKKALEIAKHLKTLGRKVDLEVVSIGALLHDIGRAETHDIKHGLRGYEFLKRYGLEGKVCRIARNHIGSGISREEAKELGLPLDDYLPESIEEKIVAYADNLTERDKVVPYEKVLETWKSKFGENSQQVRRFEQLHNELER